MPPQPAPSDHRVPRLTIAMTLAGLVAACLVPAVLGLAWMLTLDYRAQETTLLNDLVTRARTMRLLLDGELATVESGLRLMASTGDLSTADFTRFRERLDGAKKMQRVDGYALVDADGRVRIDTRSSRSSSSPTLQPVFATGTSWTSGIVGSGDAATVTIAIPVARGDRTIYALGATLSSQAVIDAMRFTLPDGWVAAVIDRDGRIVARTRDASRFVGEPASASLRSAIAQGAEGVAATSTVDGVAVTAGFSRSDQSGWTIAVGAPQSSLAASLHRSIAILVASVTAALAFVLWIAWRVSRIVSEAVGGLVEPALSLGAGRTIDLPPTGLRETDAVGRAMRQASRMLATAQHHAYHDPLTNLRNRTLFDEMATRQIAQAYRDGAQLAILAIDLDGFKAVNDLHGHAAGDLVLQAVADRITALVRGSDVVSRRGGDEFSVLLVDVDGMRTRQVAEKLLEALSRPYADVRPAVSASIGVARYPQDATTLAELLEHADAALYAAKHAGKRRVVGDF